MFDRKTLALAVLGLSVQPGSMWAQTHTVAITVDDLPMAAGFGGTVGLVDAKQAREVNRTLLRTFAQRHVPVTGFVVEQTAEAIGLTTGKAILRQWTKQGFDLGNHLYSHADVNTLSLEAIEEEIVRGEATFGPLLKRLGRRPAYLRFPYNHTGDTREKHDAIADFMTARGYRLAPCTIDNTDYAFNATYVLALSRHDQQTAAKVRAAYVTYTGKEIDWYTALDKQVFGYEPAHIMLLHDSPLNAATIGEILELFEQRGYRFVSLTEALKDPAYAVPESYITRFGPMWGYRWAQEKQVKVNGHDEPDPPLWVGQYVTQHRTGH